MDNIVAGDPETRSHDVVAENLERLKALFPDAFTEGKVDFEVLRQLLGDAVDDGEEKYGLNWHGKRHSRQLALTPSTGTLRPCPEDSVDWDTTQNLLIEGDNLEVLKLLQKSYAGKVKVIYIDPPYNTGKDFVYPDDFRDGIANYLHVTGQADGEEGKRSSNPETSGRFHTKWLNMLYPRLWLARSLLSTDGAIFVSIDETELPNLRLLLDEVFGTDNAVSTLTVLCNPRGRAQDKHFAATHDYVVCYSRTLLHKGAFKLPKSPEELRRDYPDEDDEGRYRRIELRNTHREFGKHNRPNLYFPLFASGDGTVSVKRRSSGCVQVLPNWNDGYEGCWTWGLPKVVEHLHCLQARKVKGRMTIYVKDRAAGARKMLKTVLLNKSYATDKGQKALNDLFDARDKIFQSPKSPSLLSDLIATRSCGKDVVMDFFAGSGTLGQAVVEQNGRDGGERRYVLVQLPEPTGREDYATISDIAKERLRRVAEKVKSDQSQRRCDVGFRVFRLDTSNIQAWNPRPDDLENELLSSVDHILPERSEQDVLYELLLKVGLDLCVSVETRTIAGKSVCSVDVGRLIACLDEDVAREDVGRLALGIADWHNELSPAGESTIVFLDSAFVDDVAKTNLAETLSQRGLRNLRSV